MNYFPLILIENSIIVSLYFLYFVYFGGAILYFRLYVFDMLCIFEVPFYIFGCSYNFVVFWNFVYFGGANLNLYVISSLRFLSIFQNCVSYAYSSLRFLFYFKFVFSRLFQDCVFYTYFKFPFSMYFHKESCFGGFMMYFGHSSNWSLRVLCIVHYKPARLQTPIKKHP